MASTVTISAVEVVIARGSIRVSQRIEARSTAQFTVVDVDGDESYARGQPVVISDPDATQIFGGFIDRVESVRVGHEGQKYHSIVCMDNHYSADKRLVVATYAAKTCGFIVDDIFDDYLDAEGITIGEIQLGPTVQVAAFNFVRVSDAISGLAELANFTWYISEDKKLYFIARETNTAPWAMDSEEYIFPNPRLILGNPLYRNRQYIRGGTGVTSEKTDTFTGDGVTKSYALGFPLASEPTIVVNAVEMDVGIKGVESGKDWYWSKGDENVTAEVAPTNTHSIVITYYGQYPLLTITANADAIVARAAIEGGTGIVEDIVDEVQHESQESSTSSGAAKLVKYCQEAEKFIFQTTRSGLKPGQILEVTYSPFSFTDYEMLIESVIIRAQGDTVVYDVQAITGPVLGGWTQLFADLVSRQDKILRIGDSQILITFPIEEELVLQEEKDSTTHATEDYHWDDADAFWGFCTWG